VATKAKPHTIEVRAARVMSRIGIAAPRTIYPERIMPRHPREIWSQTRACRQRTNRL
jgi:hypothetical protein